MLPPRTLTLTLALTLALALTLTLTLTLTPTLTLTLAVNVTPHLPPSPGGLLHHCAAAARRGARQARGLTRTLALTLTLTLTLALTLSLPLSPSLSLSPTPSLPPPRLERLGLVRRIDGGVEGCRYVAKPLAHAARTLRHRTVASAGATPCRDPTPTLT